MHYDVGDGLSAIAQDLVPWLSGLPSTPVELCAAAQALVVRGVENPKPDIASPGKSNKRDRDLPWPQSLCS
jgi:hypothetical protein